MNKASFSADGEHIVATGMRNKLFYIYDMMEGKVLPVSSVRGEIWSAFTLLNSDYTEAIKLIYAEQNVMFFVCVAVFVRAE